MVIVTIYVKPYVAHYLKKNYSSNNIIELPRDSNIKYTFLNCLSKSFYKSDRLRTNQYTASISVKIDQHNSMRHGHTLDINRSAFLNHCLEEKIKLEMFFLVTKLMQEGFSQTSAIKKYQQLMGYTEDVFAFDTIKKTYQRIIEKNISQTVPCIMKK